MKNASIDRRTVLSGLAGAATVALAGCGALGSANSDDTVLAPPENYDALQDIDPGYPFHGEELPGVTVEAPLRDRTVSTREFVGERHVLTTFVYTRCGSVCPALTANLVQVQADAVTRGYENDVALLATTFDPEYDTTDRLEDFGRDRGAAVDADNWYFLRPESEARVREVVVEAFGHPFQENDGPGMPFIHNPLLVLANDRGYVERAYANEVPDPSTVLEDVRTVVG
jgi:protein SCO1/2